MRLELGKSVRCGDEVVGKLDDVVIDPVKNRVTDIVVKPEHGDGEGHLVPISLVETDGAESELVLGCTRAELEALPTVERFAYLRGGEVAVDDPDWDVGVTRVLAAPYYGSTGLDGYIGVPDQDLGIVYDRVPKGEVEIRRTSGVYSADGKYIGAVDGFLVDDEDRITHFVLERGHLWGRREVTVPIGAVAKVESDTVTVELSADEIGELPSHRVHRWPWAHGE